MFTTTMKNSFRVMVITILIVGLILCLTENVDAASKNPAKPTLLKLTLKNNKATLKWSGVKNAKHYQVYVKAGKGKYKLKKTLKKTTYTFKGKYGTSYQMKVRAGNGKKKGAFCQTVTFKLKKNTTRVIDYIKKPAKVKIIKLTKKNNKSANKKSMTF